MKIVICIVLSLILPTVLVSQEDSLNRWEKYNSEPQSYYTTFQLNYASSPYGKIINTKGVEANFGFNPARFFSKQLIIGVTADVKIIPGLMRLKPTEQFLNDLNEGFMLPQSSALDSSNALTVLSNFNSNGIIGNDLFYIGGMISLFPQKFGGILLQVKTGNTLYYFHQNIFGNEFVNGGGNDKWNAFTTKNLKVDLTFKPLALFKNTYITRAFMGWGDFLNAMSMTLFFERINFQSSEFNGTKYSQFTSSEFMHKYKYDYRFGFKLGFSLY